MENNNPNIISNDLDQAPKTWKLYQKRLENPELKKEIEYALKKEFLVYEYSDDKDIKNWWEKHEKEIPVIFLIDQLSKEKKVSFLYDKECLIEKGKIWLITLVGPLIETKKQIEKLWAIYIWEDDDDATTWENDTTTWKNDTTTWKDDTIIKPWEVWTFFTFKRNDYWQIELGVEQIQISTLGPYAGYKKLGREDVLKFIKKVDEKNKE